MQEKSVSKNFERLYDVEMNVTVRFGKTQMALRDVVRFGVGSMIELNRTVDEPVELLVNNFPFAHGEVVVIDGYYGVRITDIGTAEQRSQTLIGRPDLDQPNREPTPSETEISDPVADETVSSEPETGETVSEE